MQTIYQRLTLIVIVPLSSHPLMNKRHVELCYNCFPTRNWSFFKVLVITSSRHLLLPQKLAVLNREMTTRSIDTGQTRAYASSCIRVLCVNVLCTTLPIGDVPLCTFQPKAFADVTRQNGPTSAAVGSGTVGGGTVGSGTIDCGTVSIVGVDAPNRGKTHHPPRHS